MNGARTTALAWILACSSACRSTAPVTTPQGAPDEAPEASVHQQATFERNEFFSDSVLREVVQPSLEEFASSGGRRAFVDDAAFDVEVRYRGAGFHKVRVDWALEGEGASAVPQFVVEEGPRAVILSIQPRFKGEHSSGLEEKDLQRFFEGPRTGLFGGGDLVFVKDRIGAAVSRIESEYVARGYLQVRVGSAEIEFDESERFATVTVPITEGERSLLVRPPRVITPVLEQECLEAIKLKLEELGAAGQSFQPRLPYQLRGVLVDLFSNHGYPDASIEFETESKEREGGGTNVSIQFQVTTGPKVVLTQIRFEGNESTRGSFLRSRLALEAGAIYDARRLRQSLRALYKTGLFRQVSSRMEPEVGSVRSLVIQVVENPSFEVFLEPGYGSYELFRFKVGTREKNLWGTGRQLRTQAKVAVRALEAEVGLTDPWFLRSVFSSDLSLRFEEREQPSFTSRSTGAAFVLTYRGSERTTDTFGYQLRRSEITDVTADAMFDEETEDLNLASLRGSHRYDSRNDYFMPTAGRFGEFGLEFGDGVLGSELDFLRATGSLALYQPLSDRTSLAFALRSGWITPLGDDDTIPIQERFFNGGENTVRSYTESTLGPLDDDGDPLGGEAFAAATIEMRRVLGNTKLSAALFYDLGFVVPEHQDFFDPDEPNIGSALGAGLRYRLPVGPLRLDLGWNPNRGEGEDNLVLHFSLGMAF